MLWVCLIGYKYSCTSIAICLFKLFEAFNKYIFCENWNILFLTYPPKRNVVSGDSFFVLSLNRLVKEGWYST